MDNVTLRDYFAAAIIQGCIDLRLDAKYRHDDQYQAMAEQAYKFADAMLKARQLKA